MLYLQQREESRDNFTVGSRNLFEAYINNVDSLNFILYNLNFFLDFISEGTFIYFGGGSIWKKYVPL